MSETVVLCEGYYDRAFWKGLLGHLGCGDPQGPAYDPWGDRVAGGDFAFRSKTGRFIRVRPCGGRANVLPAALIRLRQRATKTVNRLALNVDSDFDETAGLQSTGELTAATVLNEVANKIDPDATMDDAGDILIDGGQLVVSLIHWKTDDPPSDGIPSRQTLERLVCSAIVAAYPDRAEPVRQWLASRPQPPADDPKAHAWSYMAGWYADRGCDAFYSTLWQDERIAGELTRRLQVAGAWDKIEALAS